MDINQIILESYTNREFEYKVAELIKNKQITIPCYLSPGSDHIPPCVKAVLSDMNLIPGKDYVIFPQHRNHSWWLTFCKDHDKLLDELLGKTTGCNKGYGGSASISIPNILYGHNGYLASQTSIACGYAHGSNKLTICVLGDASCEEDEFLTSLGYAATKNLNILFLVEDNNLSILTEIKVRRSWDIVRVADAFGITSRHSTDGIEQLCNNIKEIMLFDGPKLLNIKYCRHLWHSGAGNDGPPARDVLKMI